MIDDSMQIKIFSFFILLFCVYTTGFSQELYVSGKVTDEQGQEFVGCNILLISQRDSLDRAFGVSKIDGTFELEELKEGSYLLEISFVGYLTHSMNLILDKSVDLGTIVLKEDTMLLDEVVITESMVKRFADKKEYSLTNKEKEQYSSALSALDFLPKIQVIDQDVTSIDGKSVKILINGIPSTAIDLSVIPTENISKIDYYTQPPIQYSNMGLGAVINVVTKEKQNGGSVGINTQNAVTTGFGNNVVNFKYNWGNSQIGVTYNINYRNYNKRVLDEEMAYSIGGTDYEKTKSGRNSPYAYEQQMAEISYNNSK